MAIIHKVGTVYVIDSEDEFDTSTVVGALEDAVSRLNCSMRVFGTDTSEYIHWREGDEINSLDVPQRTLEALMVGTEGIPVNVVIKVGNGVVLNVATAYPEENGEWTVVSNTSKGILGTGGSVQSAIEEAEVQLQDAISDLIDYHQAIAEYQDAITDRPSLHVRATLHSALNSKLSLARELSEDLESDYGLRGVLDEFDFKNYRKEVFGMCRATPRLDD